MNLLALLIGLVVERLATKLFHLRDLRWLDRLIDIGFQQVLRFRHWPALIPVTLLALLPVLPVVVVRWGIIDVLHGFPYFLLAIVVLFFSLGPNDIGQDVARYCEALESGDEDRIRFRAKAMTESDLPADFDARTQLVEEAVFVQATNRLFAVIFWFLVLGPVGAWAYRVTDLIRRRAVFNTARGDTDNDGLATEADEAVLRAASDLHGWLAWLPARLTAVGYGLAGSFDGVRSAWRTPPDSHWTSHTDKSERLLARVGTAALAMQRANGESDTERAIRGATAAMSMVFRLLIVWAAVIAAMTLYGLTV